MTKLEAMEVLAQCETGNDLLESLDAIFMNEIDFWDELDVSESEVR